MVKDNIVRCDVNVNRRRGGIRQFNCYREGDVKVTVKLLQKGADPNVKDSYGYALAQARGSKELEEALISQFGY